MIGIIVEFGNFGRVGLAVSCHRSNTMVLSILEKAFSEQIKFAAVIVVDSQGDESIRSEIRKREWPVVYHNSEENLGAAGNHAKRLELAALNELDWCYFLNHDGHLDFHNVKSMLITASMRTKVGAVYPLLYNGTRAMPWEDGRRSFLPSAGRLSSTRPPHNSQVEVMWGSSNGALYNLAPYRDGVRIWTDVWHGYEDLGYGALLHDRGWVQLVCRDAVLRDAYDYKKVRFLGKTLNITDKPAWYAYYGIRNLMLLRRRRLFRARFTLLIVQKMLRETAITLLLRGEKRRRLQFLYLGFVHGLTGKGGKWRLP